MQEFVLLPSIMGRVPKSHSIHVQNPTKFIFPNKDLVWRSKIRHVGQNKMTIQFACVPYAIILEFLEGEQGDMNTLMEWNVYKNIPSQMDVKQPIIKNHLFSYLLICLPTCLPTVVTYLPCSSNFLSTY